MTLFQTLLSVFIILLYVWLYFQIYWSENGELLCISTDESFFILKYKPEAVEAAADNKELVTEDGIEDAFDVSTVS